MIREQVRETIAAHAAETEKISDQVWGFAETCFQELQSSKVQADYMESLGFRVKRDIAGMPSAFIAEAGCGKPVLAILGENDALASLNQEADVLERRQIKEGTPGHGCGHNLLGVGGMEAAIAVKEYLEAHKLAGTVRYYACPAEEGGGGKVFLILDHQFDDVDATVSWHPGNKWEIVQKGLAIVSAYFRFQGKAAHAARAELGRSALDALELTNVGLNFLREHVQKDTIMHYSITNSGGAAANVVQEYAEGFYILRNPDQAYVRGLYERVLDICRGAALMTGTTFLEPQLINNYANMNSNKTMDALQLANMQEIVPLSYTEEELEYGRKFQALGAEPELPGPYSTEILVGDRHTCTDVCDVSWVTPLAYFNGVTLARGTVGHNWAVVAQGKSSAAHKGMHASAEIMANTLLDLVEKPEKLEEAKAEFAQSVKDKPYETLMVNCTPNDYRQ